MKSFLVLRFKRRLITNDDGETRSLGIHGNSSMDLRCGSSLGEFLDLSAFSLPSSSSSDDANTRFPRNLTRFRGNYAVVLTVLLALTLIARPIAVPAFVAGAAACFFLPLAREDPLTAVFLLCYVTVALRFTAVALGVVFLFLHTQWRGTEDLVADDLE